MEKEICRRHLSREGTGCAWLFMNMFDLRHGGSNHKLLMDKKRGSRRITGIESKVEKQLTCDCDCEKSVKKLIEEEIDEKTHQKCDSECRGKTKARNGKRRSSRTCSKTSEDINALITGDDDHAENKPDDQCPRTSQSDADSIDDDDSEEKFSELIKRLIAQKESEVESFKNLVDDDSKEESSFVNISTSPVSRDSHRTKEMSSPNESRTQTIVVLKPEPNCFDLGLSPGRLATRNKAKNGSRFTLSRIRRRLKSPKNPCNAQHDSDQDPDAFSSSNMSQNSCLEEEIETSSGRHLSDGEILPEANNEGSKKSMCGIYIEAKKHLSEMLAEGGIDVGSHDKEVPRILGKILALPQFSTPENSPRMTLAQDSVAPQITEKPNIQQCSSEDYYSETLGSDSNDHEETKSDMPVPRGKISFSIVHQDAYADEDKFETHDDLHKHTQQPLEKETYDEKHSPCSPPSSSVKMSECQDNATDVPGKSSPVSVLEPFFTDDDTSPNPSRFSSVEMRLKPLCIRFEEPDSPRPEKDKNRMDDKEVALAYIQDVVTSSELNWEELLSRSFYSDQVLEQALMDDIDFCSTTFCNDKKLLFDCINEVLMEFCRHGPWICLAKPAVLFFPDMESNAVEVVQEEVYWHLLPLPSPHTLDQIVRKDLARNGCWMDLRFDIGSIGSQTGEIILEELLDEVISTYTDLFQ